MSEQRFFPELETRRLNLRNVNSEEIDFTCGYHLWDRTNNIAEIGYDLLYEFSGQGYIKEALISAIESGFSNMRLNWINAYVALNNKNSIKLLESIGFINEHL